MRDDASWERVLVRWSAVSEVAVDAPAAHRFEGLDGLRLFWLLPAPGAATDTHCEDGWIQFRFGHGYPAGAPHAPDAPYLLVVHIAASLDVRDGFRSWLHDEHGPRQTSIRGVRWLQAYEQEGAEHSFLNLWGVDDPAIVDGDDWVRVRESAWWRRVAHVTSRADRGIYRRAVASPD